MGDSRLVSVGPGWLNSHADTLLSAIERGGSHLPGATTDQLGVVYRAPADIVITSAYFYPDSAYAAGATALLKITTAASTVTVASRAASTVTVSALAETTLTMSTVSGATVVRAGERLVLKRTTASADTVVPGAAVEFAYYLKGTKLDGS
jgi:hypothetical protein